MNSDKNQELTNFLESDHFKRLARLGVPGIILVVFIATSTASGAAAITSALATIGLASIFPFGGMYLGLLILGILAAYGDTIVTYKVKILRELIKASGKNPREVKDEIKSFSKLPKSLENKLNESLDELIDEEDNKVKDDGEEEIKDSDATR